MIQVGDKVVWQKREPGKLYVGIAGCKVEEIGKTADGTPAAILSHLYWPGEKLGAPLADLHKD